MHDIVAWARSQDILCQGRGSAANSVVCYCLGITSVNPVEQDLLIERFISQERQEPPDIDVDFEHERREEVIQYVYRRYGRERAAICATVIHYRPRSAIRDVGKALGLTEDVTGALASTVWGSWGEGIKDDHVDATGCRRADPRLKLALELTQELINFPRHLSQHVGGFILTKDAAGGDRAGRQRRHGRPHLHRVGQGRHRRARPDEGRRAGARHAHRHPQGLRA